MTEVDLVVHNIGELVTCAPGRRPKKGVQMLDIGMIRQAGVAINQGLIHAVGDSDVILREHRPTRSLDAGGKVVMPGLVECHTHLVYAGDRLDEFERKIKGAEYLEILEAGGGILSTVRATRSSGLDELVSLSSKRLERMYRNGVTTCEVKTGYGLESSSEMKMLDAIARLDALHPVDIVPTFLPAHAVPPEFSGTENEADSYVREVCEEMIPAAAEWFAESHFVRKSGGPTPARKMFVDVFCEKGAFSLEQSRMVLSAGKRHGFALKAHSDEFNNLGCTRFAIEEGAVSVDHLDAISAEEISLLADSETVGVVTPTVNFNFGSAKFADARGLIDGGCAIAISTDYNPGSAPCPSLATAMAIACRYQKVMPAEALNAVTVNAAAAVALEESTGSVEVGKRADLVLIDCTDHREICYEFGGNPVKTVIKNGVPT